MSRLQSLAHLLYHAEDPQSLTHEDIFKQAYGKKVAFKEQLVYDILSQFGRQLGQFLALRQFEQDSMSQQRYHLAALGELKHEKAFQRQASQTFKSLDKIPFQDQQQLQARYEIHREISVFEANMQRRDDDQQLVKTVQYLDLSYWSARLKYSCELLNRQNILQSSQEDDAVTPVIQGWHTLTEAQQQQPALQVYWQLFQLLKEPENTEQYHHWMNWLEAHFEAFSADELRDLYSYAQNYCIRRINQGDHPFLSYLFRLFESLVEKNLVLDGEIMDHRKLKNMVTVGIRLKAFEWVGNLLENYREKLLVEYQQDAYLFNLASLRYAQGRHAEALELLQQVEFKDIFYALSAKSLMLKLYYESDEDTALEFLMETFRLFLQRNRLLNPFQRKVHLNLLRFTRKLYRLRDQRTILPKNQFETRIQQLAETIRTAEDVPNRSWLLQQAELLIPQPA
ncbi:MAG: hypothetical protein AAFP92_23225 [Bacteroidota bacterium]